MADLSNVYIMCEEKAYEAIEKTNLHSMTDGMLQVEYCKLLDSYFISLYGVKWYRLDPEFDELDEVIRDLMNSKNEQEGYAFTMIEVKEDNSTRRMSNVLGDELYTEFYPEVIIHLPKEASMVEIIEV